MGSVKIDDEGVMRDGYGRYMLPTRPGNGEQRMAPYTRVTTFAKTCADTFNLNAWSLRTAIEGLVNEPGLFTATAVGLAGATGDHARKEALNTAAELAREAGGGNGAARLGTLLHALTESWDAGIPLHPEHERYRAGMVAWSRTIADAGFEIVPEYTERIVLARHERFEVGGKLDRIVRATRDVEVVVGGATRTIAAGELVVLDLKTGRSVSYSMGEIAVQLMCYARAQEMLDEPDSGPLNAELEPMPLVRQDVGLVLHLPAVSITSTTAAATMHAVDLDEGWRGAQICALVREWRKTKNLSTVVHTDEAAPSHATPLDLFR